MKLNSLVRPEGGWGGLWAEGGLGWISLSEEGKAGEERNVSQRRIYPNFVALMGDCGW